MFAAALHDAPAVRDAESFAARTGATSAQLADLQTLQAMLVEWNHRMNLVSDASLSEFWSRHAFDSAQLAPLAPRALTWVDIGAGAGFPGLVLAILMKERSGAKVNLVESHAKRCRFLDAVCEALALPAEVHNARAEAVSLTADVVTARAVAPLIRLLGFAEPFMARGAVGWFLKSEAVAAEIADAKTAWRFTAELAPSLSDPRGRILKVEALARAR